MQELVQTTVKKVIEDINNGVEVHPKVLNALFSIRNFKIVQEDFEHPLDFSFTLTEWREIENKSEPCSDEEFLQIFPHLTSYVE